MLKRCRWVAVVIVALALAGCSASTITMSKRAAVVSAQAINLYGEYIADAWARRAITEDQLIELAAHHNGAVAVQSAVVAAIHSAEALSDEEADLVVRVQRARLDEAVGALLSVMLRFHVIGEGVDQ